ncbi:MAG TPA: peptidylprolyl isomerase [Bacteroidales bacterium]|nr:peptidylprolyl isomerase [Bacteroidales bacterium]
MRKKIGIRSMRYLFLFIIFFIPGILRSQVLVESVAATVGNEVIYLSELESTIADMRRSDPRQSASKLRCQVLNEFLISKLFLEQARIDSVTVTKEDVQADLNMQINRAVVSAGSEEALERAFNRSILDIRKDAEKRMMDQQLMRKVQNTITQGVALTPAGLKKYYSSIPKDSIPVIPARYEFSIIQLDPPSRDESKAVARQRLLDLRSEILAGKSFSVLARLYSEDIESAKSGGEIGFSSRGMLEKEYADVAFSLSKNTVSRIVETRYGYHIIQLIDRKNDMVNTRHILIRPKISEEQSEKAISKLDSIADQIRNDSITFENAAMRFSTHKDSRTNGGKFVLLSADPSQRKSTLSMDEMDADTYMILRDMNVGEISDPFKTVDEQDGREVFRIVRLDKAMPAHTANLKDDYQMLYNSALQTERNKVEQEWVKEKIKSTYIRISDEYKTCDFLKEGWLK